MNILICHDEEEIANDRSRLKAPDQLPLECWVLKTERWHGPATTESTAATSTADGQQSLSALAGSLATDASGQQQRQV
jgi:hypothetical protein